MAIVSLKQPFAGFSGTIGEITYFMRNGKLIARQKPKRLPKRTKGQKAQQSRLSDAAIYWRGVKADPAKLAYYAALPHPPGLGPYHLAVRDFMHPPVIEDIDVSQYSGQAGETIAVRATDDSAIDEVAVQLLSMDNAVLEEGLAQREDKSTTWNYTSKKKVTAGQTVSVRVTAKDRPGNTTTKTTLAYVR